MKVSDIIRDVEEHYNLSPGDIVGHNRKRTTSLARGVSIYLAREITQRSYNELAEDFSKDHRAIMYQYNKIKNILDTDCTNSISSAIFKIRDTLGGCDEKTTETQRPATSEVRGLQRTCC